MRGSRGAAIPAFGRSSGLKESLRIFCPQDFVARTFSEFAIFAFFVVAISRFAFYDFAFFAFAIFEIFVFAFRLCVSVFVIRRQQT